MGQSQRILWLLLLWNAKSTEPSLRGGSSVSWLDCRCPPPASHSSPCYVAMGRVRHKVRHLVTWLIFPSDENAKSELWEKFNLLMIFRPFNEPNGFYWTIFSHQKLQFIKLHQISIAKDSYEPLWCYLNHFQEFLTFQLTKVRVDRCLFLPNFLRWWR